MGKILLPDYAKKLINWQYGICSLDSDASEFGPFRDLVLLWQEKIGPDLKLPRRSDFDFFDFRGWWGKIAIATFEREPFDVRFVLWGTDLAEWWGVDYTKKSLGEKSITPEVWKLVESKYFEEMTINPFIGLVSGHLDQHDRPFVKVLGVDLPLSDGQAVSQVLSAHIKVGHGETLESRIPNAPIARYF